MGLVVGINAYADVNEYDRLINQNFPSFNPIRKFWDELTLEDKECLIVSGTYACDKDDFMYKDFKLEQDQPMQFPRINRYKDIIQCPDDIKIGIILNVLRDSMMQDDTETEMRSKGIKSFADGTGAKIELEYSSKASLSATKNSSGFYNDIFDKYFKRYCDLI